ncbi:CDP-glycerol glycerophosphotransferase family protein [Heyndrickxia sp. FSL K6-6286]|uniref:CDP-glycerol glycerophosphotransferase family protein n=1 Tax=Heyndrickxia TaxID=2837504 RepID=UPI00315A801A
MNVQGSLKCTLKQLGYADDQLVVQILVPVEKMATMQECYLLLIERQTDQVKSFPLRKISEQDQFVLVVGSIRKEEIFTGDLYWDLYVGTLAEGQQEKFRVHSDYSELEALFSVDSEQERVFIPYTTNKGNVSIKLTDLEMITHVDHTELSEQGILSLSGFAIYPDKDRLVEKLEKKIVIKSNDDEFETNLVPESVERKDLTEKYGHDDWNFDHAGFNIDIDLKKFFGHFHTNQSLKIYVEYTYYGENRSQVFLSNPLKYPVSEKKYAAQLNIIKTDHAKKKIRLSRSKKAKYLTISIGDYQLKQEIKSKIRRKIIQIRRHPLTKKMYQTAFKWIGYLPRKKNVIVFESFLGKQYSDNPRALYEYLQGKYPHYKMYWSVNKKFVHNFEGRDLQYIRRFSVKWLFTLAQAKYWVTNSRMPLWIPKPRNTVYLQTWHGTPLKRLASDMDEVHMPGTSTQKYKANFIKEASNWDYLVSPNEYSSEIFRRAFQFDKVMIESGYPRNDFLLNSNNKETMIDLKKRFGIPLDRKVLLYAPTWRDDQFYGKGKYKFDLDLDLSLLRNELGEEYVVILRMHYLVAENFDLSPYEGFAFDFSNHEDIRELYLIADLLITDYSSVFFDYGNLRRPMIFYVYDIESYRDKLRGFYFDFEQNAPGPLVKTTEEVIAEIKKVETEGFTLPPSFEPFYQKFCYLESGQSSKKVVETVFGK